ncbi:MAG: response regulator transcription factor [Lachnospiraceae bacterium]|nr:response regulator transcription factor [Lachnospiraceae bacterium]
MKAAIIEDDEIHADLLEKYLLEWSSNKNIIIEINKYPDAENFLFEWEPGLGFDVLFIDIQMQKMNGVEMARTVRKKDNIVNIIFTTGITGYMEEGYDVEAMHYLVKPVNKSKIYVCMDKIFNRKKENSFILVHSKDEVHKIMTNQINYIEARGHGCIIELFSKENGIKNTKLLEVSESISELETIVKAKNFTRCHRSYLCSIPNIHHIGKTEVTFDTGSHIPVSRRLHKDVNQAFIKYFSKINKL